MPSYPPAMARAEARAHVTAWNRDCPAGTPVWYWSGEAPVERRMTRSEAFAPADGLPSVLLAGSLIAVPLDRVDPIG